MVIHLKQNALHLFNLALAGCACGVLVDLFKATYGYPKTEEQKAQAKEFKQLKHQFSDAEEEVQVLKVEEDKKDQERIFSHPFQAKPSTSAAQPSETIQKPKTKASKHITPEPVDPDTKRKQTAKKSHISQMTYPDCVRLVDAIPLYPTTSVKLCWTRVTPEMFTTGHIKEGSARVSVYSCSLYVPNSATRKCNYSTGNSCQMGTHVHRCHLAICIQCKKCGVCSFCTCDMMKHLKVVHANDAHVFYVNMPDLSGMQAQDISHELVE